MAAGGSYSNYKFHIGPERVWQLVRVVGGLHKNLKKN